MYITDEMLSAFLDDELPEKDVIAVREAIRLDDSVTGRLARLASTDAAVKRYASAIDAVPMPAAVLDLLRNHNPDNSSPTAPLDNSPADARANVTELAYWRRAKQRTRLALREHAALAAGLALTLGITGGLILGSNTAGTYPAVAGTTNTSANPGFYLTPAASTALDNTISGQTIDIGNLALHARFSFVDTQSRYCRQFHMQDSQGGSEHLACHNGNDWELIASARASSIYRPDEYQTASNNMLLDSTLDALMRDPAITLEEEAALIQSRWRPNPGQ